MRSNSCMIPPFLHASRHVDHNTSRMTAITPEEQAVRRRLDQLGISFERYEHPPVATVEEAEQHWAGIDAAHCKNLFLQCAASIPAQCCSASSTVATGGCS